MEASVMGAQGAAVERATCRGEKRRVMAEVGLPFCTDPAARLLCQDPSEQGRLLRTEAQIRLPSQDTRHPPTLSWSVVMGMAHTGCAHARKTDYRFAVSHAETLKRGAGLRANPSQVSDVLSGAKTRASYAARSRTSRIH